MKRIFGDRASAKSGGELDQVYDRTFAGRRGGLEAGISVLALRDQILPPTINQETPDPRCDLDYVPNMRAKHGGIRALEFVWFRRHQRRADIQALGRQVDLIGAPTSVPSEAKDVVGS